MQPTIVPTHPPRRSRLRGTALLLAVGLVLAGCGSSGGDDAGGSSGSSGTSTTAAPVDGGSSTTPDDGATTTTAAADAVDLCEAITADQVSELLGATLQASPNPALTAPSCNYTRDIGGVQGAVVKVEGNEPDYFASQQELQTEEQAVPELGDAGFALTTGSPMVYVQGKTHTWVVTQGVEIADGGQAPSLDQLVSIAKLLVDQ